MNIMTIGKIENVLSDLDFFVGISSEEIFAELDNDLMDFEILYTLEELRERVVTKLVEQGRTYEMPEWE